MTDLQKLKAKGKNFMTPVVLFYGKQRGIVFELSTSTDGTMFGVTTLYPNLNRSFTTLKEADEYIENNFNKE